MGAIHEKHTFKYFKYLTVKLCKIWCNDGYMSILQCDIFWWKLNDRNFFNPIFNTKVVLRASPLFCSFHCFARDYLHTGYSDMLDMYSITTLSSVLKPKYSLSIRNKCAYLLESSETSITIWRQEYPQNCYI
jgi:hypothetical protein